MIEYRLQDLGRIVTGRTPAAKNPHHFGEDLPFLTPTDMGYAERDIQPARSLSSEGAEAMKRAVVPAGSVSVVCIGATIGKACLTREPTLTNQQINSVVCDPSRCDARYLFYVLTTKPNDLKARASGAATPIINKTTFGDFTVTLPPLPVQRRIAEILSAYDDLIAVNERRIAILEEMARRLFVQYSGSPILTASAPEGDVQYAALSELADFVNGFAFKPSHQENIGLPIVKIPELKNGVLPKTPRNSGEDVPAKYHLDTGDLLFSWSGTLAANCWTGGTALLNQHLFKVVPGEGIGRGYLLSAIRESIEAMMSESVGATMKHIRRGTLSNVFIRDPRTASDEPALLAIESSYLYLVALHSTQDRLRKARDLLLPRLVSGELDVSEAPAPAVMAAE